MSLSPSFNPENGIENHLPPELGSLLADLVKMPARVRAMWRYAFVLLMIEIGRARFIEMREDGDTLHLIVKTTAGDVFSVMRPPMSEETEQRLLEEVRAKVSGNGIRMVEVG